MAEALFGRVRCAVLALLYFHQEESFYLRQIVRLTGAGHGAVQRELGHLWSVGVIVRRKRGKELYYQANASSPIFAELRNMLLKTAGVADLLRAALAPLAERIEQAFIYGSVARGADTMGSDVDVMIIGDVGFGEVVAALHPAQEQLHREVNPSVYTPEEIRQRVVRGEHFITTVLQGERLFLIGDADDVARMASA